MVIRTLHWTVPCYWVWGLPFFLFYFTRSSQFFHERPNQSCLRNLLCLLSSPTRYAVSKFVESYLMRALPLRKYGLKLDHPFLEDFASCQMAITSEKLFPVSDKGMIKFKRATKWWFWEGGIEFKDNSKLEVEVLVLATGFWSDAIIQGTINPMTPNMAFLGYLESVANLELRSIWLAQLVDEKFKLPTIKKMVIQIYEEMEVMKRTTRFYKRHCISTCSINHSDDICEEMGW